MGKFSKKLRNNIVNVNNNLEQTNEEELSEDVLSPLKSSGKKKKRRKLQQASDVSSYSIKEDGMSEDVSPPQKDPVKKMKKKKNGVAPDSFWGDASVSGLEAQDEPSVPSTEDILAEDQMLIEYALNQVHPEEKAYQIRLDALDYKKIAKNFKTKSPEECKESIKALIEKIPKIKCLHQVLQETLNEIPSAEVRKNNFSIFIKLNKDKIKTGIENGLGKDKYEVASVLWKELSADEKIIYKQDCRGASVGKSPFDIFKEYYLSQHEDSDFKVARTKWQALKSKKKLEFIAKSAKLKMELDMIIQNLINENIDKTPLPIKVVGPSKTEVSSYLEHVHAPDPPPKIPAMLYWKKTAGDYENTTNQSILLTANKRFRALDTGEQESWSKKLKKAIKRYENELEDWKKDQPDFVIHMYEERLGEGSKHRKTKTQKSANILHSLNTISMPVANLKFSGEPVIPPLSAKDVYAKHMAKKNREKVPIQTLRKEFSSLPEEKKIFYQEKSVKIREAFVNALKSYVDKLHEEQRKLFLGCNRIRYIHCLGEDIFEYVYPSERYPAYTGVEKKIDTAPKKKRLYSVSDSPSDEDSSPTMKQKLVNKDSKEAAKPDQNLNESKSRLTLKRHSKASDFEETGAHTSPKKTVQTKMDSSDDEDDDDDNSKDAKKALNSWISSASATMTKYEKELMTEESESDSS